MVRLGTYAIITPNKFSLDNLALKSKKFEFNLEPNVHTGLRTVLLFYLIFLPDAKSLTLHIKVNGKPQATLTTSGYHFGSTHIIIDWLLLKEEGKNTIEFSIQGGTGTLEVEDVVLLYQRNVQTA